MKNEYSAQASTTINAPKTKVWDALTEPAMIKQYFFGTDTHTDWKVGSAVTFTGEWQGKTYEDKGTVLANETGKRLQYTYWSSMSGIEDKPENYVTVTYEITEKDDHTLVTISQDNIPTEEMKKHSEENWSKVLEGLKKLLEH